MKRSTALLLALVMLLGFTACGTQSEGGAVRRHKKATESTTEVSYNVEDIIGQIDGQRYENSFIGLGCQLDDSWMVESQENAALLLGLTGQLMDAAELIEQKGVFCDFYALYSDGYSSINIMVQKENAITETMSDDAYLEAALASAYASLEAVGFSEIQSRLDTVEFAGQDRRAIRVTAIVGESPIYEAQIPIRRDGYIFSITAASFNEDLTEQFLSYFYKL